MAVADLLMSQRRWGQTRCRKFLAQIAMSEKKTVGSMTDRQRRTLAAMLTAVPSELRGGRRGAQSDQAAELENPPFGGYQRTAPSARAPRDGAQH